MANLIYVALLVASTLLVNINGMSVQYGPCPADENGEPHLPGDSWYAGCSTCRCWDGYYGCMHVFPTCTYPEGCMKLYNENGCEVMAVMENHTDQVCDPISCWGAIGK
uniref:VWFC domain-containing protein n=1 Tax=Branchiostoma floridae TaxID=7739 RepID=C3Z4Z1_BRAFL|eukprot:XP_002596336.1 hypothetical protein BRAFLDRAFT_76137 [Branchiostoma floridae]